MKFKLQFPGSLLEIKADSIVHDRQVFYKRDYYQFFLNDELVLEIYSKWKHPSSREINQQVIAMMNNIP